MSTSIQLQPSDTIGDAFAQMETLGVTELPVVDSKRRILGIIREVDLRKFIALQGRIAMFAVTVGALLAA
jgi:CBS domain-containing protein